MKILQLIIVLSISLNIYGQKNKTLSEKLWLQVGDCNSKLLEDKGEDGQVDYDELIDDSKNGYLKISGSLSPCGCPCSNIVGAYKTNSKRFVFVNKSAWGCEWKKSITSNDSLNKIFPIDFETVFLPNSKSSHQNATFYIDLEIPRKGTDTKATIKVIPFGLNIKSDKNIVFAYSQEVSSPISYMHYTSNIMNKIQNTETLQYLLKNEYNKISNEDIKLINEYISKDYSRSDLVNHLKKLKVKYDLYSKIKHQTLILGWDREKESFYIKEKGVKIQEISFLEFIKNGEYWMATC